MSGEPPTPESEVQTPRERARAAWERWVALKKDDPFSYNEETKQAARDYQRLRSEAMQR